jgi:chromosome segregation ATPase
MKTILPWILAVAFAACAVSFYLSGSAKDAQLAEAREQVQQLDTLRSQIDDLQKQASGQNDQIASMRKDNDELLSLRSKVRQLTDEKAQLSKQLQNSQAQVVQSQAEVQQVQARASENANSIAEQRLLQIKQAQDAVNGCINNLRLIDGAKQQWALENNKTANDIPQPHDLLSYFPSHMMPECPGGGRYTINAVGTPPTCSIAGHTMQQQR